MKTQTSFTDNPTQQDSKLQASTLESACLEPGFADFSGDTVASLADSFLERSHLQSVFSEKGHISHLLVMMRRDEFFRLYPRWVNANVFVRGHWLQFSLIPGSSFVVSRRTGVRLVIRSHQDPISNQYKISFWHRSRRIHICRFNPQLCKNPSTSSFGLQKLALSASRALEKLEDVSYVDRKYVSQLPCIHILPEAENDPVNEDFQRSSVEIQ